MEMVAVSTWQSLVDSPLRKLWPPVDAELYVFCKSQHTDGIALFGDVVTAYHLQLVSHIYPAPELTAVFPLGDLDAETPLQVPAGTHIAVVRLVHPTNGHTISEARRVAAGPLGLLNSTPQDKPEFVCVLPEHRSLVQNQA